MLPRPDQPRKRTPQQHLQYKQTITAHTATPQRLIPLRRTRPHLTPQHKSRADSTQHRARQAQEQKRMMQTRMIMIIQERNADSARTSSYLKRAR